MAGSRLHHARMGQVQEDQEAVGACDEERQSKRTSWLKAEAPKKEKPLEKIDFLTSAPF